ncbi:hypothetical protein CsSME_00051985 [Camellia sinensis var. sinensis]|uniref:Protein TIFY n=1 Tax=Camellia sinensis TaxID=4442 RepID=A0A167V6B0_CAMSI|nr:jasmonate-zim-domain protein [Camellia sinensis]QEG58831.1 jasmonate ZIM-domain 4 [Camellia sinensis]
MASSQVFSDDRRSGKSPEKSNFALTCNRLSQFLKERRSLGDLGFEIAGKIDTKGRPETTRNMVPKVEKPVGSWAQHGLMDLFPQHADLPNKPISSKPNTMEAEPKTAPMTIFYGGKVFVFDSFPADKAGDLMLFAGSETNPVPAPNPIPALGTENQIKSGVSAASGSLTQNHLQSQTKATHSDLPVPIARRASLHRFFEKRKDRATARAPYQVHGGPSTSSSSKHEEQLDLKL